MSSFFDPEGVDSLIRRAASEFVLPRFQRLQKGEAHEKLRGELVTIADLEAESFLTRQLANLYPGSVVVGRRPAKSGSVPVESEMTP